MERPSSTRPVRRRSRVALICPLQVLEDEHQRPLPGKRLEMSDARPRRSRSARSPPSSVSSPIPASGRRRASIQAAWAGSATSVTARWSFSATVDLAVSFEDACLRLDDLSESPERHAVAVGKTAALAPRDQLGFGIDDARQLVEQPALADAGYSHQRHELEEALVADAVERSSERRQSSRSRPTRSRGDLVETSAPKRARASSASHTATGSAFPFASTAPLRRTRSCGAWRGTSSLQRGCR